MTSNTVKSRIILSKNDDKADRSLEGQILYLL